MATPSIWLIWFALRGQKKINKVALRVFDTNQS